MQYLLSLFIMEYMFRNYHFAVTFERIKQSETDGLRRRTPRRGLRLPKRVLQRRVGVLL